jgi:hypothetical protein
MSAGHAFVRPGQVAPHLPPPDQCARCGQPEDAHGTGAELAARRTAATAVLADFGRYDRGEVSNAGGIFDWSTAAHRLAAELRSLLEQLGAEDAARANGHVTRINPLPGSHVRVDGVAEIIPEDVGTVLGALSDAAGFLEERGGQWCEDCNTHPAGVCEDHGQDLEYSGRYRSLGRALGDDR